jgi:SAM-dependent methyltransferase
MVKLDVGAGPHSEADIQIDRVQFPKTTIVQDVAMEKWKVSDCSVDEVRMEMIMEHCPSVVEHFNETTKKWETFYPRVHLMAEAYRVLVPGGILHVSVPGCFETHSQDPTHCGPQITDGFFNYFCGEWGGGDPADFAYISYGITFKFKKLMSVNDGFSLTVRLQKE